MESLIDIHPSDLALQVEWARNIATKQHFPMSQFNDAIDLKGSDLSKQFERATAFAKKFLIQDFVESALWDSLQTLCPYWSIFTNASD